MLMLWLHHCYVTCSAYGLLVTTYYASYAPPTFQLHSQTSSDLLQKQKLAKSSALKNELFFQR